MPIGGERPETGVRILIERDKAATDPPWSYAGAAHLPHLSFPLAVRIDAGGGVDVDVGAGPSGEAPPPDLAERVRLIVRTVYRQAKADDEPPAWRIVRWRGEK